MNTVLGVCQAMVVIMFACRFLTRPCSLATCRGDLAKVGAHLNIPFFFLFFSFFKKKERRRRNSGVLPFSRPPSLLPPRVWLSDSANAVQPLHRNADMNVGSLYNCRVPLIKQNTCFGSSAHWTPTVLMEIELFPPSAVIVCLFFKGAKTSHTHTHTHRRVQVTCCEFFFYKSWT